MRDSAHSAVNGAALAPDTQLGSYVIIRQLGQGGFGITYLAYDKESHHDVVIKENMPTCFAVRNSTNYHVVPAGTGEIEKNFNWALERFIDETQTISNLQHPNIVKIEKAFRALGTAYYVMPLIEGTELHYAAPSPEQMSEGWLRPILLNLLQALSYVHSCNILHRDIKPANIILRNDSTPILIDFGAARSFISERSATRMGTEGYTPIEQVSSLGKLGPWSDIYALAATCYALITGQAPPDCISRVGDTDPYQPLTSIPYLESRYSQQMLKSIDKALSVDPTHRWQSANEWLKALTETEQKNLSTRLLASGVCILGCAAIALGTYHYLNPAPQHAVAAEAAPALPSLPVIPPDSATTQLQADGISRENYDAELLRAVMEKNAHRAALLIAAGANVNQVNEQGTPLLHIASTQGDTEIIHRLISAPGIELNKVDSNSCTAVYAAAETGNAESLRYLLAAPGVNINQPNVNGATPLFIATQAGHAECVRTLLAAPGIDVNMARSGNVTPMYIAAQSGHTECMQHLVAAHGINLNPVSDSGDTPLIRAACNGHIETLRLLLNTEGVDLNRVDNDGKTAMECAMAHGRPECAELLRQAFSAGAPMPTASEARTRLNELGIEHTGYDSAICTAATNRQYGILRLLIAAGADVNVQNSENRSPLHLACEQHDADCLKLLLAAPNIDVNIGDEATGTTPLIQAAENGHTTSLQILLQARGIDVNRARKDGGTPLFLACQANQTECVQQLLEAQGIDPNRPGNNDGATALYQSCLSNHEACVRMLLAARGIDVNKTNTNGDTPLSIAAEKGHNDCLSMLLAMPQLKVNAQDNDGNSALYLAAEAKLTDTIRLLLEADGIEVNIATNNGRTPLMAAAASGSTDCVRLLLGHQGVNPSQTDNNGATAVQIAREANHIACANMIELPSAEAARRQLREMGIKPENYHQVLCDAADQNKPDLISLIIAAGADVNATFEDYTPAFNAAFFGHEECLALLLEAPGIDVNKLSDSSRTPLFGAAHNNKPESVRMLLAEPGIDVNLPSLENVSPLYAAASKGHTEVVQLLLAAPGIDVNHQATSRDTPLSIAAGEGHIEIVRLLLAHPDTNVNQITADGKTPLFWATHKGHRECARLIREAGGR